MTVYKLNRDLIFPDPSLADPEGLLAVGGDLRPERILLAYSMGIFPWYSDGQPILWWSPDPRLIVHPSELHISKSLRRTLRKGMYQIAIDTSFPEVISHCGATRRDNQSGTWITKEIRDSYIQLHMSGFAHSVESYYQGKLVGGLYGVSLGRAFFGESMFSLMPDASKVCLAHLGKILERHSFDFIDCQVTTNHLLRMGAKEISREEFLARLNLSMNGQTLRGNWKDLGEEETF